MFASLAAAALLNASAAQASISNDQLPDLFVAACLDGSVRMANGDATPIPFGELPAGLRSRLGNPTSSKVWKLRVSDKSYLYLLDYAGRTNSRTCGVAGENLSLRSASAIVGRRLSARPTEASSVQSTEWLDPRYRALATRAGGFTIL